MVGPEQPTCSSIARHRGALSRAGAAMSLGKIPILPDRRIIQCLETGLSAHKRRSRFRPLKPDIPPDDGWTIPMRKLILSAFAALTLIVGVAPMARAYTTGFVNNAYQSGQYDNFGYGSGDVGMQGGGN